MSYCARCGASNKPEATECVLCGTSLQAPPAGQPAATQQPQAPQPPPSPYGPPPGAQPPPSPYGQQGPYGQQPYAAPQRGPDMTGTIILSVFATVCCACLPIGVYSLVQAIQANSKSAQGDVRGALEAQQKAKTWAYVSIAIGVVLNIIAFIVQFSRFSRQGFMP